MVKVREYAISPVERSRRERWRAVGRARVVSKKYGAVVVPCRSKLTALMNAEVWAVEKDERAVPVPRLI